MYKLFKVRRDVIQGDVMSPVLNQLIQDVDTDGQGVKVDVFKELRVLGYADDAAMIGPDVEQRPRKKLKFKTMYFL